MVHMQRSEDGFQESVFPCSEFQGSNSYHQDRLQVPLPTRHANSAPQLKVDAAMTD